jgi:hypothetical protein
MLTKLQLLKMWNLYQYEILRVGKNIAYVFNEKSTTYAHMYYILHPWDWLGIVSCICKASHTGWPDLFVKKISQNVYSPQPILVKFYALHICTVEKSSQKSSVLFKKAVQRKQQANSRKFSGHPGHPELTHYIT